MTLLGLNAVIFLAFWQLAAARRALHKTAPGASRLIRLAAYVTTFYLAAFGAKRHRPGVWWYLTTAGRAFHQTTTGTLSLVRQATHIAALYLAAGGTKLNGGGDGLPSFRSFFAGLLAAIGKQNRPYDSQYNQNYQNVFFHFHNWFLTKILKPVFYYSHFFSRLRNIADFVDKKIEFYVSLARIFQIL